MITFEDLVVRQLIEVIDPKSRICRFFIELGTVYRIAKVEKLDANPETYVTFEHVDGPNPFFGRDQATPPSYYFLETNYP